MTDYVTPYTMLTDIPGRKYEGYIWESDKEYPQVLQNEEFQFGERSDSNPFIVEALLYCKQEEVSISVRHTGRYHIREFNLKNLPEGHELVDKKYYQHRLNIGDKKVCFQQLWLPEPDPNCEGMEVLQLKAHIFTGFEK